MLAKRQSGVSLIEMMIGLAILAIALSMGMPSFQAWLQNSQIRNAAQAIQNGLTLARVEAVRRNTSVRFQLVSDLTNACARSDTGTSWVISLADVEGRCDEVPMTDGAVPVANTAQIIQIRSGDEGSRNVVVDAHGVDVVTFTGTGRSTGAAVIDLSNPTGGGCATQADRSLPMRCLRVTVSAGGQIRMCDPARPSSDPQGC